MKIGMVLALIISVSQAADFTDPQSPTYSKVCLNTFKLKAGESKDFFYRFEKGDTVEIRANAKDGETVSRLIVSKFPQTQLYSAAESKKISTMIVADERCVLKLSLKNQNTFLSKTYALGVYRNNPDSDVKNFITSVTWKPRFDTTISIRKISVLVRSDTVAETLIDQKRQIPAQSPTYVSLQIPKQTDRWVYWVTTDPEADKKWKEFCSEVAKTAGLLNIVDPLAAFALGQIPALLKTSGGSPIDYFIIGNTLNLNLFMSGKSFYPAKDSRGIISDYATVNNPDPGEVYLGFFNPAIFLPRIITIKAVALKINNSFEDQNKIDTTITTTQVPEI